ncbi:DUF551 domain-containing protein [Escherichia coli]|uniref:DUF551 domain-containing protein n=1 Tax=Escherichia coli TaxID=562 RepID=UPI003A8BA2DE
MNDKELIKEIKERISSLDVRDNVERRAYDIALASLTAEPVAWKVTFTQIDREYNTFTGMYSDKAEVERWVRLHKACNFRADITPLYTAQPVPVTPDGWISCSERMPNTKTAVLVAVEFDRKGDWRMKWATYIPGHPDANDGWIIPGASWKPSHWMPLPEPPQGVNDELA